MQISERLKRKKKKEEQTDICFVKNVKITIYRKETFQKINSIN